MSELKEDLLPAYAGASEKPALGLNIYLPEFHPVQTVVVVVFHVWVCLGLSCCTATVVNTCWSCAQGNRSFHAHAYAHTHTYTCTYTHLHTLVHTGVDERQWKTISGQFSSVMICPHTCCSRQAPMGVSPYAHVGNGCADLVLLSRCSKIGHAKWILRQRKGSSSQVCPKFWGTLHATGFHLCCKRSVYVRHLSKRGSV